MPDPGDRAVYGEPDEAPSRRSRLGGIVAVVAMLGFGVGLWYVYDRNIQRGDGRPPTVVAADKGPVKTAPADPGGMQVPNTQTGILNQGRKVEPKIESLLPPPERPAADPPPAPKAAAPSLPPPPSPPPTAIAPPPAPAAVPAAPPAVPPVTASMPAVPAPAVEVAKAPPAEPPKPEAPVAAPAPPVPVAPAAPPKAPAPAAAVPPPPAPSGGLRIQLASLPDAATAEQEWKRLQKANADVLGNLTSRVVPVQLEGKGTWYRLQAGPFADKAGAQQACEALKQRKLGCFLAP